jgi:hypothetical protein
MEFNLGQTMVDWLRNFNAFVRENKKTFKILKITVQQIMELDAMVKLPKKQKPFLN